MLFRMEWLFIPQKAEGFSQMNNVISSHAVTLILLGAHSALVLTWEPWVSHHHNKSNCCLKREQAQYIFPIGLYLFFLWKSPDITLRRPKVYTVNDGRITAMRTAVSIFSYYIFFFSRPFSEKPETYVTHNLNANTLSLQHNVTQKFWLFLWILLIKSVLLRDKCYSATPYLKAHFDPSATGSTLTKLSPCRGFSKSFWVMFYACDSWIKALSASCNISLKVNHYIVWRHLRKKTPLPIHSPEYFKF